MKNFKKLMALVIAGAMVLASMNMMAFGAAGDLSVNGVLEVSGLDEGDTVTLYQILKWDPDNSIKVNNQPVGWVWGDNIDTSKTDITDDLLKTIIGTTDGSGQISSATAGILAACLKGTPVVEDAAVTGTGIGNAKWTDSVDDAGLYMTIVTPKTPGTMYNPIFIAANWYGNDEDPDTSNSIAVSADKPSYSNNGMAKKSTIPLDKTATGSDAAVNLINENNETTNNSAHTTDIGEEITYAVTTKIPKFGANYTAPVFKLHDTLTGLAITAAPAVYEGKYTAEEVEGKTALTTAASYEAETGAYVLTDGKVEDTEYTIQFTKAYLNNVGATGQDITIVYKAKVIDAAAKTVNQENNTVDLSFSTNPDDSTGYGLLRDETNHFTFSIDANLLGSQYGEESSTEAIKIGVDAEGKPIVSMQSYSWNNGVQHAALEGATFTLHVDNNGSCGVAYVDGEGNGRTAVSDASGRITIKGLDAGNYWLVEDSAPAGYIKLQNAVPVVISAKINENKSVDVSYTADGHEVTTTHVTNELVSYSVTIGGSTTSYTMENSADGTSIKVSRSIDSSDKELANTKGVELPSTGGMGTTLFYAIGAVLVLGAGILLVSKRRMAAN